MPTETCNVAVFASGAGSNFKAITEACRQEGFPAKVVCLITDNPDAGAIKLADSLGVPSFVIPVTEKKGRLPRDAEEKMAGVCADHDVDLIALAGFMRILKGPLLDAYENRVINIHPALLPSFKGLHSARQAIDYGVKISGCTVHFVDRSIDGGPIIIQAAVPVEDDDTEDDLLEKIHVVEHKSYIEAVRLFAEGRLETDGRRVRIR